MSTSASHSADKRPLERIRQALFGQLDHGAVVESLLSLDRHGAAPKLASRRAQPALAALSMQHAAATRMPAGRIASAFTK